MRPGQHIGDELRGLIHFRFFHPRVVKAGVPSRNPLVTLGERVSKGIKFLLVVIPA